MFLRCNADHHAANFMASAKYSGMHHVAYEMRDPNHLSRCSTTWPARLPAALGARPARPGHNLFTYHRDPDGHVIELFTQIDVVHDEAKGYWEPRPWHEEYPMYPKTWQVDLATVNQWGPVDRPSLDHWTVRYRRAGSTALARLSADRRWTSRSGRGCRRSPSGSG